MRAKSVREDMGVGIGAGGMGGYGNNNMMTPQSQSAYAHNKNKEESEDELGDLDLADLKNEFFDDINEFKRGGNPYEKLGLGIWNNLKEQETKIRLLVDLYIINSDYIYIDEYGEERIDDENGFTILHTKEELQQRGLFNSTSYKPFDAGTIFVFYGEEFILPEDYYWGISTSWVLENKELFEFVLKESLNEFKQGGDPYNKLGIGSRVMIDQWFETWASDVTYTVDDQLNIHVKGSLDLEDSKVTSLPDKLHVGGHLYLRDSKVTSLPDGLHIGLDLYIRGSKVTSLPDGLYVGGYLDLSGSRVTSLPDGLYVGGSLDLRGSKMTSLPDDLVVKGKIHKDF
jgi:hypothetical protein